MIFRAIVVALLVALTSSPGFGRKTDIHLMCVGDKARELVEDRQLTYRSEGVVTSASISPDGRVIAYVVEKGAARNLCMVSPRGKHRTTVLTGVAEPAAPGLPGQAPTQMWRICDDPVWSPNSKLLAVDATRVTIRDGNVTLDDFLLVLESNGKLRKAIPLPAGISLDSPPIFSPDSHRLAAAVTTFRGEGELLSSGATEDDADEEPERYGIIVLNVNQCASTLVRELSDEFFLLEGWTDNGASLMYSVYRDGADQLRKTVLGAGDHLLVEDYQRAISPDAEYMLIPCASGVCAVNRRSGRSTQVVLLLPDTLMCWAPNSRMFLFRQEHTISDPAETRQSVISSLWLASVLSGKHSTMCVAVDYDEDHAATLSFDCLNVAYVGKGALHVAEIVERDAKPDEKVAAGIPLTEDEEKTVLEENAKRIGNAVKMFLFDWEGVYPNADTVTADLEPYLVGRKAFLRPGTDEPIFKFYLSGMSESDIPDLASTAVGELDAGYDWTVVVYADGHVKVVLKE